MNKFAHVRKPLMLTPNEHASLNRMGYVCTTNLLSPAEKRARVQSMTVHIGLPTLCHTAAEARDMCCKGGPR